MKEKLLFEDEVKSKIKKYKFDIVKGIDNVALIMSSPVDEPKKLFFCNFNGDPIARFRVGHWDFVRSIGIFELDDDASDWERRGLFKKIYSLGVGIAFRHKCFVPLSQFGRGKLLSRWDVENIYRNSRYKNIGKLCLRYFRRLMAEFDG